MPVYHLNKAAFVPRYLQPVLTIAPYYFTESYKVSGVHLAANLTL